MMHSYIEGRNWRYWWGANNDWNLELAWGLCGLGVSYTQSSDSEQGRTGHLAVVLMQVFFSLRRPATPERSIRALIDSEYLWVQWYVGDDEMDSHPWMCQWPWRRWHHVSHDRIGPTRTAPYRYELESGEIQVVDARYTPEEREWRWMWPGCPIRSVQRYIDVAFSAEVGDGTGSWKGGTVGCNYDLRPHEQPLAALRRMERERRFR